MLRFMFASALFVVALGMPGGAAGQKADAEKLAGTWTMTAAERLGKSIPIPEGTETLTFSKDGKVVLRSKGRPDKAGTFAVRAGKTYLEIDLVNPKEADKEKRVARGLYKLDGDTLTIAASPNGGWGDPRPNSFDSEDWLLMILKRQKP